MKRKVLSLLLTFCMALSLMPVQAFAADPGVAGAQPTVHPAILHDASDSDAIADNDLYDHNKPYTAVISGNGDGTTSAPYNVDITISGLKEHSADASGKPKGYWVGVALIAPADATGVKFNFSQTKEDLGVDAAAVATEIVHGDSDKGIAFYSNAADIAAAKKNIVIQWMKGEKMDTAIGDPIYFELNLDKVEKYQAPVETKVDVTYEISGGTWDGTNKASKTEKVTLTDGEGTLTKIPDTTKAKPDSTHQGTGKWMKAGQPVTNMSTEKISQATTYTYTFEEKAPDPGKTAIKVDGNVTAAAITYGDKLSTSQITGNVVTTVDSTKVEGTWEWPADQTNTVLAAGDHKLAVTFKAKTTPEKYEELTAEVTVKVNPKELTVESLTATNRQFNGTNKVQLTGGKIADGGKVGQDEVNLPAEITGTIADVNASTTAKNVTVDTIVLTGKDAANYTVASINGITVTISKAAAQTLTAQEVTFGKDTAGAQTYSLAGLMPDDAGTLSYQVAKEDNDTILTEAPTVDQGTGLLTYTLAGNKAEGNTATITVTITSTNYEDSTFTLTVKLNGKQDQPELKFTSANTVKFGETLTLVAAGGADEIKDVTYTVANGTGAAKVENNVLTPTKVGTVTVTATKAGNEKYNDATATQTITINKGTYTVGDKHFEIPANSTKPVVYDLSQIVTGIDGAKIVGATATENTDGVVDTVARTDSTVTITPYAKGSNKNAVVEVTIGSTNYENFTVKLRIKTAAVAQQALVTFYVQNGHFRSTASKSMTVYVTLTNNGTSGTLTNAQIHDVLSNIVSDFGTFNGYWMNGVQPTEQTLITATGASYTFICTPYNPYYPPYNPNVPGSNGTVVNPDGSTTTTVTRPDGTRVETTLAPNGTKTEVVRQTNGTVMTTETRRDGTQVNTTTDTYGNTTSNVYVPYNVGETVVTVPTQKPVSGGTVAVIVNANGTETIVKDSVITGRGVALPVAGRATVKIRDNTKFFADVQSAGHWAADAVEFVTAREIFNGTGAGKFEPNAGMTRGMLAVALHNLENNPQGYHSQSFNDVASDAWYAEAVQWAASQGIVSGFGDGKFAPNEMITREQLAVMLYRYAKDPQASYTYLSFNDAGQVGGYAEEAVRWAVANGILTGKPGNLLDPQGNATRAEVAAMLQRFLSATVK